MPCAPHRQSAELAGMMVDKVALSKASQGPSEGDVVWTATELTNENSETMLRCTERRRNRK